MKPSCAGKYRRPESGVLITDVIEGLLVMGVEKDAPGWGCGGIGAHISACAARDGG